MELQPLLRRLATLPILLYQKLLSPLLPGSCIYRPTCSDYAREAVLRHGLLKGLALGLTRITRCAAGLFVGGEDPVPAVFSFREAFAGYARYRRRRRSSRADGAHETKPAEGARLRGYRDRE